MPDRLARFREIGRGFAAFKVALQICVLQVRLASGFERIGYPQDDEPTALRGVEDAGAIAEAAGIIAEFMQLAIFQI